MDSNHCHCTEKIRFRRICIDYKNLKNLTRPYSYLIPKINKRINAIGDGTFFATLDAKSGYLEKEIQNKDREMSAFSSYHDLYRFVRMLFGLKSASRASEDQWTVFLQA